MDMKEFEIREYPEIEYKADMLDLLAAKGLKQAVKKYLDMIVEETSGLPYIPNMSVKEWACDILTLCELEEERYGFHAPDMTVTEFVEDCLPFAKRGGNMPGEEAICILRESDIIENQNDAETGEPTAQKIALEMAIKALEQESKTGHWIVVDEGSNCGYYCSECQKKIVECQKKIVEKGGSNLAKKIKRCPNCGCRIIEPRKSEKIRNEDSN